MVACCGEGRESGGLRLCVDCVLDTMYDDAGIAISDESPDRTMYVAQLLPDHLHESMGIFYKQRVFQLSDCATHFVAATVERSRMKKRPQRDFVPD